MVESSKGQHEEFEDDEEVGTDKGKSREKNRSKHSETEQRRRSKINERFQILRDLIPQNDQKRDKASFLLEVIEYIQFLQERLNVYEGSYQGWNSEPRKLIPWKSDRASSECFTDHNSRAIKNGPDLQTNVPVSPSMLHDQQNSLEPDISFATAFKTLDQLSGSATQSDQINAQQSNRFSDPIGSSQPIRDPGSDIVGVDPLSRSHEESWQGDGYSAACLFSNTSTSREEKTGSASISTSYSQGVLDTLAQALQSSGTDMSRTSISVQMDVTSRIDARPTSTTSVSKDHPNRLLNSQMMESSQITSTSDKHEHARKRLRIEQ